MELLSEFSQLVRFLEEVKVTPGKFIFFIINNKMQNVKKVAFHTTVLQCV